MSETLYDGNTKNIKLKYIRISFLLMIYTYITMILYHFYKCYSINYCI